MHDGDYYLKAPNIASVAGNDTIAKGLLNEATINERLIKQPHPSLGVYLVCVVHNGLIVHLFFLKYVKDIFTRTAMPNGQPTSQQECMTSIDHITAAATHLH